MLRVTLCPRCDQREISWAGYVPVCRVRQYTCSVGPTDCLVYLTTCSAVMHSLTLFGQSDVIESVVPVRRRDSWIGMAVMAMWLISTGSVTQLRSCPRCLWSADCLWSVGCSWSPKCSLNHRCYTCPMCHRVISVLWDCGTWTFISCVRWLDNLTWHPKSVLDCELLELARLVLIAL